MSEGRSRANGFSHDELVCAVAWVEGRLTAAYRRIAAGEGPAGATQEGFAGTLLQSVSEMAEAPPRLSGGEARAARWAARQLLERPPVRLGREGDKLVLRDHVGLSRAYVAAVRADLGLDGASEGAGGGGAEGDFFADVLRAEE